MHPRPDPSEYAPFYATYVDKVPAGDVVSILADGVEETLALLATCPEDRERYRYAPGKWSIREVVGHVVDAEHLFFYRALHFARGDRSALPGVDSEAWAARANAGDRPLSSLWEELAAVRAATLCFFSSLDAQAWDRSGVASGYRFTVRALAYTIAGHEIHHRGVLADRYFDGPGR